MNVGLFGGTFDPIHLGHVDMICQLCEHMAQALGQRIQQQRMMGQIQIVLQMKRQVAQQLLKKEVH